MAVTTPVVVVEMPSIPNHSRPTKMAFFDSAGDPINFEDIVARLEQIERVIAQLAELNSSSAVNPPAEKESPVKSSRKPKTTN